MKRIKFDRNEVAGAFGDLGTFIPLVLGLIVVNGLSATSVMTMYGLAYLFTGIVYAVPIPVQPMKAIAAISISQGASPEQISGAGLVLGLLFVVIAMTGLVRAINRVVPKYVVRGIQLALGLKMILIASSYIFQGSIEGWVTSAVAIGVVLIFYNNGRIPSSLLLLSFAGMLNIFRLENLGLLIEGVRFSLPKISVPEASSIFQGFLTLGLPQIPLTIGNSIIATALLSRDLFPSSKVSVKRLSLSLGFMNSIFPFLGGVPICHGCGGLASHYRFGARTRASILFIGVLLISFGLFFGEASTNFFNLIPMNIVGVFLLFAGVELSMVVKRVDMTDKSGLLVMLAVTGMSIAFKYGMAVGMIVGPLLLYTMRNLHGGKHIKTSLSGLYPSGMRMSSKILKPTGFEEALDKFVEAIHVEIEDSEEVSSLEAVGRVLSEDVASTVKIPPVDVSVMDGYAVRSEDTQEATTKKPTRLKIVGRLYPDSSPGDVKVSKGEAAYVATGAPIPQGADAVEKIEFVRVKGSQIQLRRPVKKWNFISIKGADISEGVVLKRGHTLRPQDVGLLLGIGRTKVRVLRKPKVAILSVGDELTDLGSEDTSKKSSNYSLIVSRLLEDLGADPKIIGVAPDESKVVAEKLAGVLDEADVLITIAGISVGEKDIVPDAVKRLEPRGLIIHGVKMKPGRVTGLGTIRGKPFIALPGHIASTIAGFYAFVAPIISYIQGLGVKAPLPTVRAKILHKVERRPMMRFLLIRVKDEEGLLAEPIPGGSSLLRRIIEANGFLFLPAQNEIEEGEEVNVTLLSRHELNRLYTQHSSPEDS
ncbi:MAG: molybdate transporter family protein [Candidatus Geothermarchaeales archaeon]